MVGEKSFDAKLLASFANGGLNRSPPRFQTSPGAIDLAGTETAFFTNQKNPPFLDHKEQSCAFLWLPCSPIEFHEREKVTDWQKNTNLTVHEACFSRGVFYT